MKLVCLGDSLTSGFKIQQENLWTEVVSRNRGIQVVNKGIKGDTTAGMFSRFYRDVIEERPSCVFIMGGTNDMIWGVPLSNIESNIAAMVQHAYHYSIRPVVGIPIPVEEGLAKKYWPFIEKITEVNILLKQYRQWLLSFTDNFQCRVFDFYHLFYDWEQGQAIREYYSDGLHPNIEGNKKMAEIVDL